MSKRKPKTTLTIRIDEDLRVQLVAWATADRRSLSSLVQIILADAVTAKANSTSTPR